MSHLTGHMRKAWEGLAARLPAYELVLPGTPSFECLIERCPRHCCRIYNVSLGEWEVRRLARESGLTPARFLESEDGEPLVLPLAQPYTLRREAGQCALLAPDMRCGQYHGRPNACRLYPHFVLFVEIATGKPVHGDLPRMEAAALAFFAGEPRALTPVLLRHLDCPGFGGPPLGEPAWTSLLRETCQLQYGLLDPPEGAWTQDIAIATIPP